MIDNKMDGSEDKCLFFLSIEVKEEKNEKYLLR